MGSKQSLSNGNEPQELTDMLHSFEKQDRVVITIHLHTVLRKGKPDILLSATAVPEESRNMAAESLASVNAICWGSDMVNLMGLFTSLLYKLDFMLAEQEWGKVKTQR